MREQVLSVGKLRVRCFTVNTAIVGSGAAGYNAADRLFMLGQKDILILSEERTAGTSRNTGSDKQTYYKLTVSGGEPDSVREMAQTLFEGQCVDGDIALCEAALSVQGFLRLVELGVPFPRNRYGEFVGYKTDHDPRCRASSVGPYTSRKMTEQLERSALDKGITLLDHTMVIRILQERGRLLGLLCLNMRSKGADDRYVLIQCKNVIYATGGPAGIYRDSAYPASQYGASGIAYEAGIAGRNLTEWQYGMASVAPRWNVSGSYMQVLPRMYSSGDDGQEHEFLLDFFDSVPDMLSKLFLKGYQWPFDVRKVESGSSIIDILVYLETCKGRHVYLDYRTNPAGGAFLYEDLSGEAYSYMSKAGICFGTPYERLARMNRPAVDFYLDKGVDLAKEPLEIAICAQHNNGGLAVDCWWQTGLEGFFAVGEVAGSHGVYRPGGAALNSGQVGSTRAAQYIAARRSGEPRHDGYFEKAAEAALAELNTLAETALTRHSDMRGRYREAAASMSIAGAAFRSSSRMEALLREVDAELSELPVLVSAEREEMLLWVFRYRDLLLTQKVYLSAYLDYIGHGGMSRGSALYTDPNGKKPYPSLPEMFTFRVDNGEKGNLIQEVSYHEGKCSFVWRPVHPIPEDDDFFENVWRSYRENGNIV